MNLVWRIADSVTVVHQLVEASDCRAAELTGTTAPSRRVQSTQRLVSAGFVHIGLLHDRPVVTVTVSPVPSFNLGEVDLSSAASPWYMQRLAVAPGSPNRLVGFYAVRRAISIATGAGADALRAEVNPDLSNVLNMLTAIGFRRLDTDDLRRARRAYLELALTP